MVQFQSDICALCSRERYVSFFMSLTRSENLNILLVLFLGRGGQGVLQPDLAKLHRGIDAKIWPNTEGYTAMPIRFDQQEILNHPPPPPSVISEGNLKKKNCNIPMTM